MRRILCFAFIGLAAALSACSGDGDEPVGSGTPAATGASPATSSPQATGNNCPSVPGPPAEGLASGLQGRVSMVRLVFGCQPDIYIMNADGSGAAQLTDDPSIDDESDLSPDGSKIVFFSGRSGETLLYIMNADGSDLHQVGQGRGGDTSPRWAPDGSRIAFSRGGNVAVMNADGSDLREIMLAQPSDNAELCRAGAIVGGWSPGGDRITYYSAVLRPAELPRFEVCAINASDGSNVEVLVSDTEGKLHAEPHWSPDGKKIVFRDDRDGDCTQNASCNYEVYTLDLETGEQTNVTNHPAFDIEPVWSPDGQWIMFASNREDPNFDLYVIHPDGSGLQRILDDPYAKDSYASWR